MYTHMCMYTHTYDCTHNTYQYVSIYLYLSIDRSIYRHPEGREDVAALARRGVGGRRRARQGALALRLVVV